MSFPLRPLYMAIATASTLALTACGGEDGDNGLPGANGSNASLIQLSVAGRYQAPGDVFDEGAAEIVAHDRASRRLFVVNANDVTIDVLDISDVANPALMGTIDASAEGASANSVAVHGSLVAVAIEANTSTDPGKVVFYNSTGLGKVGEATVGALPDMVTFTPDGNYVLVANEGEPSDDYSIDPEGSISVIDISSGVASLSVATADFNSFDASANDLRDAGVRLFGPGSPSVSEDLEPEYIAVAADGQTAWAALQENNAVAVIDISSATVTDILPLGFKNHSVFGNELDASNDDGTINIRNWPVFGMYQPDSIASYHFNGRTYYVTANEGDARDYDTWTEEFRVRDLTLDGAVFTDAAIQDDDQLGRLRVTATLGISNGCNPSQLPATLGDLDGSGGTDVDDVIYQVENNCEYDALYSYGARSFSIWADDGSLVFDSGSEFERILAQRDPANFNSTNDENDSFDNRSDDKGPEPEGLALGTVRGQTYAFIGLERMGGFMVYNITNPEAPAFVQYLNNRDFSAANNLLDGTLDGVDAGDLGPEGFAFIPAAGSPTGTPMLAVGNEISGTTTLYAIDVIEF